MSLLAGVLLAAAVLCPAAVRALPRVPDGPVYDPGGVLGGADRAAVERTCRDLDASGRGTLVVAIVPTLESMDIETFGIKLAEAWKPGHQGKDDGVILIVAPTEHQVRIEVGYGLESTLSDGACGAIIRERITPRFKAGDLSGGTAAGAEAIGAVLAGRPLASGGSGSLAVLFDGSFVTVLLSFVLLFVGALFFGAATAAAQLGRGWWPAAGAGGAGAGVAALTAGGWGWLSGNRMTLGLVTAALGMNLGNELVGGGSTTGRRGGRGGTFWSGGGWGGGGWSGGGGGGGFGGFSGGSFGGGGASGSW